MRKSEESKVMTFYKKNNKNFKKNIKKKQGEQKMTRKYELVSLINRPCGMWKE